MARPRKDGKPAARAVRTGRERRTESGKPWRVRAYERTDWLRAKSRSPDYIANRKRLLDVWVRPVIGDRFVINWDTHASLEVIDNARPHLSPARLQDLRSTLSGLRATAHRKRAGGRWLSPDEDPLEEVSCTKGTGKQGASSTWVPPHKRPQTAMVDKAIAAAAEVGRWEWLTDALRTGGFCAARLAEQRAIDVDLRNRELDVNGVWETPPSGKRAGQGKVRAGRRKPHPKNRKRRITPYIGTMQEMYRRRVAIAFGMPEDTGTDVLAARVRRVPALVIKIGQQGRRRVR